MLPDQVAVRVRSELIVLSDDRPEIWEAKHEDCGDHRAIGMKVRQATVGQWSEKIGNANDQQTAGGNKQNFEANNARPHAARWASARGGCSERSLGSG